MELLEKYLQAVRFALPRRHQDDIVRELSENLRSQIEDEEGALGRPLTEAELADILRRHGHPMVVAGRYGSHQHLISPTLFPIYLFALKTGLGVALAVTLVITAVTVTMNNGGIAEGLLAYPGRALLVFAWTTIGFAVFDFAAARLKFPHTWDPRHLPLLVTRADRVSRWDSLGELLATTAYVIWLLLIPRHPFLLFGPLETVLGPAAIWSAMYLPIVLLAFGTLTLSIVNVTRPYRTTARSWTRLGIHAASLAILTALALAGEWVVATPGRAAADPAAISRLASVANWAIAVGLWIAVGVSLVEIVRERGRWQSWRNRPGGDAADFQIPGAGRT